MTTQARAILVSAAIVALAQFVVGLPICQFDIQKPVTKPGSGYLYVGCDNNQFSNTGKEYQQKLVDIFTDNQ